MPPTSLLIIGAGPYGLSLAALAIERSIPTTVIGKPMSFWREHMPAGMFLRSNADWHLDATNRDTFRSFLEDRGIRAETVDPIPVGLYLEYTDWFIRRKRLAIRETHVRRLSRVEGGFEVELESGDRLRATRVVAAPGIASFATIPPWARDLPASRVAHTFDRVRFEDHAERRVLIVGGRQSAYEWAALIAEHAAERVDVVHRHDTPRFEFVDWGFVDPMIASTLARRGWWRSLTDAERETAGRRFWQAGRLTLEPWLTPRLDRFNVHRRPRTEVVEALVDPRSEELRVRLSNGERLTVDRIVLATGYRADLTRVPYLEDVLGHVRVNDGYPDLDESLQTSLPGLYMTGFVATRDFGPFFGFVRATPASSSLIVEDLLRSSERDEARHHDRR
jgi:cation diffusion facilitator CzcD-associated flavoprotein CzcO